MVDFLFASSGIEAEIVASATETEILPDLSLRVASVGHLLAMKILARDDRSRPQDYDDIRALLAVASAADRKVTLASLKLIISRGFSRERRLLELWERALLEFSEARS